MTDTWKNDNCAAMKAHYAVYSVPQAAALWCGVDKENIDTVISEASQLSQSGFGRGVWIHPDVPCLEPRSRAIADAIENRKLPHGREDGETVNPADQVAYERRHILGRDLKTWMESEFPNEKPVFLFDDIERNSHDLITLEAYQSLKADRDALKLRLDKAVTSYKELRNDKENIENELAVVKKQLPVIEGLEEHQDSNVLSKNEYWKKLSNLATQVINEYPAWKNNQRKIQKSGNLQDWLVNECKASNREAELLKKILSEEFLELN
jgi:hypothetical protein